MQVDRTLKEITKKKLSKIFALRQESNSCYRIVLGCCYKRQGFSVEIEANFSGLFIIVKGIWWQLIQINCTCSHLPVPRFLFICASMGEMDCHVVFIFHLQIDQISFHSSLTMIIIILEISIGIMSRSKNVSHTLTSR